MPQDKLSLIKTLRLLDGIPDAHLAALADFLKPLELKDGQTLFEEGSAGRSLYFIAAGRIKIGKKAAGDYKDLAILDAGDCFGEMALFETTPRSARAVAAGETTLFELGREDLDRWLKSNPGLAVGFFAELLQVQSGRLRRTSSELTLLFDLSSLLLEPAATNKELLARALARLLPHLPGPWSAAAFLYNMFNDELELAARQGSFDFAGAAAASAKGDARWLDSSTFAAPLFNPARARGRLIFRAETSLSDEDRTDIGRTLITVARLVSSAVENIDHRTEEDLRGRLRAQQSYGPGI
jgi:CRP-like cAMP-binding protein